MTTHRRAILRIYGPDIQQDTVEVSQTAPLTVGRLDNNDLPLKHTKISRNHARFIFDGETLTVEDLGSSNGTLKGDTRLEPNQPIPLAIGESVTMGPFSLFFDRIEEYEEKPKTAAKPEKETTAPPQPSTKKPKSQKETKDAPEPPKAAVQKTESTTERPDVSPPIIQPPASPPPSATNGKSNGVPKPLEGVPTDASTWMQYLPEIYSESDFFKRFLLIFEAGFAPYEWIVDNIDLYLDAKMAPPEWLQWFGKWVDILVPDNIPEERQHAIVQELGMLFKARGTRKALARHLELVFGKPPEISEPPEQFSTFIVRLPIGRDQDTAQNRALATQIIESHRPVHTRYQLIID
ncbi:MAG: hypothetical protein CUN55_00820 [Phototrophicales bacterium]|nr:MAG: hypothetical protein CUN55_00820 [Phototrophicales bacterium]